MAGLVWFFFFKPDSCTLIAQQLAGLYLQTEEADGPGSLQHRAETRQKMAEDQAHTSACHKPQPQKDTAIRGTEPPLATSPSKLLPSEQLKKE